MHVSLLVGSGLFSIRASTNIPSAYEKVINEKERQRQLFKVVYKQLQNVCDGTKPITRIELEFSQNDDFGVILGVKHQPDEHSRRKRY